MIECPFCRSPGKPTNKEWDYAAFHVRGYNCKICGKQFRAYFCKGEFSHTIPKSKK